jgi:diguanylate cyclase (GGDEF)-like protein
MLVALTGGASSPFFFVYPLIVGGAALVVTPGITLGLALIAALGYLLAVILGTDAPGLANPFTTATVGINLTALILLAYIAMVIAREQRSSREAAIRLSTIDPLTTLYNRGFFFAALEREIARSARSGRGFCLLMMDLDELKAINDRLGHFHGDRVLRAVGQVVNDGVRRIDTAARYGGDEFVVLLPETEIVGAFVVAEKIRLGAEEVGMVAGGGDPITSVSIGLVSHPEDGLGAEELLVAADRAMYQAKSLGKNQISGNPRPRPALIARRSIQEVEPPAPAAEATVEPAVEAPATPTAAEQPRGNGVTAPPEDRAVAVELGPVAANDEPRHDDSEADPQEVRRQIEAASRSFDPDHQIRRAMDAFLSPGVDRERTDN